MIAVHCSVHIHWCCNPGGTTIKLHCIAFQFTSVHLSAFQCNALDYIGLHCISVHFIALQCISVQYISLHCIPVQCSTFKYIVVHFSAVQYTSVHCSALECIFTDAATLWAPPLSCRAASTSIHGILPSCQVAILPYPSCLFSHHRLALPFSWHNMAHPSWGIHLY